MKKILIGLGLIICAASAYGLSTITKPYTFTAHTGATAAQVNANEDTEINAINAIINEITAGTGALNVNSITSITFNGYSTSQSAIARHVAVRDGNGKLAGDVTGTSSAVEGLRIVRGAINTSGAIVRGTGFTCVRNSTGSYTITFSSAFSATPTTITSCVGEKGFSQPGDLTTTRTDVSTYDSSGSAKDILFNFITVGPK